MQLTDSSFFNGLTQRFSAGSTLRFQLALTNNIDSSGTPDQFSLAILDNTGTELPTTSLQLYGTSVILVADLVGNAAPLLAFGSQQGAPAVFAAPSVIPQLADVPEPSTAGLTAGAIALLLAILVTRRPPA